jgi:hypothetical protein
MDNNSLFIGLGVGTFLVTATTFGIYFYSNSNKMGAACAPATNVEVRENALARKDDHAKVL